MNSIADALHGTVPIVHEEPLWSGHLADVRRAAGAIIARPAQSAATVIDLVADARPSAAIAGGSIGNAQTKVSANTGVDGVATPVVSSGRTGSAAAGTSPPAAPYAGYQVVGAIAAMVGPRPQRRRRSTLPGQR